MNIKGSDQAAHIGRLTRAFTALLKIVKLGDIRIAYGTLFQSFAADIVKEFP